MLKSMAARPFRNSLSVPQDQNLIIFFDLARDDGVLVKLRTGHFNLITLCEFEAFGFYKLGWTQKTLNVPESVFSSR